MGKGARRSHYDSIGYHTHDAGLLDGSNPTSRRHGVGKEERHRARTDVQ